MANTSPARKGLFPRAAYSVEEFCAAHGFTKPTFYSLLKDGAGPRIMRVGRRVLISVEEAEAWRKARTAATHQTVCAALDQ